MSDLHRSFRRTGPHDIADIAQAAPHPRRDLVAITATLRGEPDDEPRRQVVLVDAAGTLRPVLPGASTTSPVWSPTGDRLCVLAAEAVVLVDLDGAEIARSPELGGTPELARWAADGRRLALVVAESGAHVSDVWGSGTVGGAATETWRPMVLPHSGGRRRLVVWEISGGTRALTTLNTWEVDWLGNDLVAVVSDCAGEGAWYDARLVRVSPSGEVSELHEERFQLARPTGSPDGRHWSALTGIASDRDLLAGALLVGRDGHPAAVVPTAEVHVTEHRWVAPGTALVIGHRGLDTVVGTVTVESGAWTELWSGTATTARYQPELGGLDHAGRPVLVLEQHDMPPTLVRIGAAGEREVLLSSAGPGTESVRAAVGTTRAVTWSAPDGLHLQGLLDLPRGDAPYPLVVHPHGGPVGAYQDGWIGRDLHTTTLVARGYAVFRPNPRGSAGRGAVFAEAVLGDMGGADVQDIESGIDQLVTDGVVDPERVGILGQSYGAFLACWMPCLSDRYRASVSRSPCTDWVSFHLTTNIAPFDDLFLSGDLWDPESQYWTRNPLMHHAANRTPTLLTAGVQDLATPANQAQQMYRPLAERHVPAAFALYPEEGHGVEAPLALTDVCARTVAWFERFMPVTP
ncbi:S9 family peptidase [Micromonospora coerulea]|uniref:S9 family peptidase n=1 Tax=Micromonospora coerulea TaxID=47856 RepID=A0ABP8SMV7_9ACTN